MATISIILRKSKTNSKGEHPIVLRLADRGDKKAYFSTGFFSTEKRFDSGANGGRFIQGKGVKTFTVERKEEGGGIKTYTNKEANDKLAELESKARAILKKYNDEHIDWGFDQFREDFTNAPKRESFLDYARDVIEKEYRSLGHYKKAEIAEQAFKSFLEYDKDFGKKSFQDISIKYLNGYIAHCEGKKNSSSTISIRLRELRRIFNVAIRDKVISKELYPFSSGKEDKKVKIPRTELNKTDQYLPLESMRILSQTPSNDPILERTRHLFLFSYHCRGINWKDMALLTKDNFYKATVTDNSTKESKQVTMMQYRRSKTRGEFDIQVNHGMQQELDWFKKNCSLFGDYVLPIISIKVEPDKLDDYLKQIRKRFNRSLKKLAKELGLPESQQDISIYTARHSFAMTLQNKGKSVEIISQALGHQSVETTKHYLAKFSTTKMAEETDIDLSE